MNAGSRQRADAFTDLHGRILGPGSPRPGTAELVGPLLGYAADPASAARTDVLRLLVGLATVSRTAGHAEAAACRDALGAALPVLVASTGDPRPAVRVAATAVLAELGWCADALIGPLQSRYHAERHPHARLALVLAVGQLLPYATDRRRGRTWLRRRRSGTDATLRLAATALAIQAGPARPGDLPALLSALPRVDPVAWRAVTGAGPVDWLDHELRHDRSARIGAAGRLFEVPAGAGAAALRAAAGALSGWRSAAAELLPAVASRLDHPDPTVRAAAAHLLAVAGSLEHAEPLAALLTDPAARVADLAAWGLSRLGDQRGLHRLRNRALMGTSIFDAVQVHHPRGVYRFSAPGLFDVLAPLAHRAADLLPRVTSALSDADSYHQRRVLAAALRAWGPVAAPAVPELADLLDSDAVRHACLALGAVGPGAAATGNRLARLVERSMSGQLRAAAAWAHRRVTGDDSLGRRVLCDALYGELGGQVLPLVADLGPAAVAHADRVRTLAGAGGAAGGWRRVEAAAVLWRLTGRADEAWALLAPVLTALGEGRVTPVTNRAVAVAATLGPAPREVVSILAAVVDGDRRHHCYGDWRAVADDEELRGLAAKVVR